MNDLDALRDGTYTAVVDTVEDGLATVFFEQEGEAVGHAVIEAADLPEAGRTADAVLTAVLADGAVVDWTFDPDRTAARADDAQARFDRLSSRPPADEDQ